MLGRGKYASRLYYRRDERVRCPSNRIIKKFMLLLSGFFILVIIACAPAESPPSFKGTITSIETSTAGHTLQVKNEEGDLFNFYIDPSKTIILDRDHQEVDADLLVEDMYVTIQHEDAVETSYPPNSNAEKILIE